MTDIVIEVGPATIRGPNLVDAEQIAAAFECIDDDIGLVDDHPRDAADIWRDVMRQVVGSRADSLVLICPTWWPSSWVDRVQDAALAVATTVAVLSRAAALGPSTLVELASELVVVSQAGELAALSRCGDIDADANAVADRVSAFTSAIVDIPEGVEMGGLLGEAIAKLLHAKGVSVSVADRVRATGSAGGVCACCGGGIGTCCSAAS